MLSNIAKSGFRRLMSTTTPQTLIQDEVLRLGKIGTLWTRKGTQITGKSLLAAGGLTATYVASSHLATKYKIEMPWYFKGMIPDIVGAGGVVISTFVPGVPGVILRGVSLFSLAAVSGMGAKLSPENVDPKDATLSCVSLAGSSLVALHIMKRYPGAYFSTIGLVYLFGGYIIVPFTVGVAELFSRGALNDHHVKVELTPSSARRQTSLPVSATIMESVYCGVMAAFAMDSAVRMAVYPEAKVLPPAFFWFAVMRSFVVNVFGEK